MAKWNEIEQPELIIEYPSLIIKLASPTSYIYDYILGGKHHNTEVGSIQPKSCAHNHTFSHLLTTHIGRVRAHISDYSKVKIKGTVSLQGGRKNSYLQNSGNPKRAL